MIPLRLLGNYGGYEGKSVIQIIIFDLLLGNDPGNLWYLPVLFFDFLIFYIYSETLFSDSKLNRSISFSIFLAISIVSTQIPNVFFIKNTLYYLLFFS